MKGFKMETTRMVRIDPKGRIALGSVLPEGIASLKLDIQADGRIVLEPYVEIPAHEAWVFQNKSVKKSLRRSIKQSNMNDVHDLGDFSAFAEEE